MSHLVRENSAVLSWNQAPTNHAGFAGSEMGWDAQTLSDHQRYQARVQAEAGAMKLNMRPISPDQLVLMRAQWMKDSSYDGIML